MASSYDLTTEEGLRAYLESRDKQSKAMITQLSGGTVNYVYRVATDDSSIIFKHAAPYLQSRKTFAFDPTRMDYEAGILNLLDPVQGRSPLATQLSRSNVHAVRLISYDKDRKLLGIEDGGSRHLKDAYDESTLDVPRVGEELGSWVAALHISTKSTSLASPYQDTAVNPDSNNTVAVNIYRHAYNELRVALPQYGHSLELAERINQEFGSLLATDNECICHGDFWPGNILLKPSQSNDKSVDLTVVDWEMVRRGTSATDVAQFSAEAFLLGRFRNQKGLLASFLRAYAESRNASAGSSVALGKQWLKRMVVHWAVHIAYWPTRVAWTTGEETQKLVNLGVGVLEDVLADDWERIMGSPLFKEVQSMYTQFLV